MIMIGANIDVIETPFESRAGNSRGLIGVEITRKTLGSSTNELVHTSIIEDSTFDF